MNKSTLISLFALVVLVALFVSRQDTKMERGISRLSFGTVQSESIDSIEITGQNPVSLVKQDNTWKLKSGRDANQQAVKRALEQLTRIESSHQLTSAGNESAKGEWGLEEADGAFVVMKSGGKSVAEFGLGTAQSKRVPVLVDGVVYAVNGNFRAVYDKSSPGWLETRLFRTDLTRVTRVDVGLKGKAPFTMVPLKENSTSFELEAGVNAPEGFRLDSGLARNLVKDLHSLRVDSYVEAPPAVEVTGLNSAADQLTLHYQPQGSEALKVETLRLGAALEDGSIYGLLVERNDVVTISAYAVGNLRKPLPDYRALNLMAFEPSQVETVKIVRGRERLKFAKKEGVWTLTDSSKPAPKDFQLNPASVDKRVRELASTRAGAVASTQNTRKAKFSKKAPSITVTYKSGEKFALRFGGGSLHEDTPGFFVKGTADNLIYWAPESLRQTMLGGLTSFDRGSEPQPPAGEQRLDAEAFSKLPPEIQKQLIQQLQAQQAQAQANR